MTLSFDPSRTVFVLRLDPSTVNLFQNHVNESSYRSYQSETSTKDDIAALLSKSSVHDRSITPPGAKRR